MSAGRERSEPERFGMVGVDLHKEAHKAQRQEKKKGAGEIVGWEFRYRRVHLHAWPDLVGIPVEQVPVVARICALVNRKPTVASLIPLILDIPAAEVFAALEQLTARACIRMPSYDAEPTSAAATGTTAPPPSHQPVPETEDLPLAAPRFITRLWSRLTVSGR